LHLDLSVFVHLSALQIVECLLEVVKALQVVVLVRITLHSVLLNVLQLSHFHGLFRMRIGLAVYDVENFFHLNLFVVEDFVDGFFDFVLDVGAVDLTQHLVNQLY
jgi:hypothetical protein